MRERQEEITRLCHSSRVLITIGKKKCWFIFLLFEGIHGACSFCFFIRFYQPVHSPLFKCGKSAGEERSFNSNRKDDHRFL